jgi:CDP-6-deoxy-D-xylo-4-hexulose-3-dehydrase
VKYPLMRNNFSREDLDLVIGLLRQDDPKLTNGPEVRAFEREWSDWLGVRYSTFVNSGASANLLTLAILKARYPEGGEVLVPTLTWVSDIASVIQNGFTPVFVDIDPLTLSMNDADTIAKLTPATRAVFLTHAQGFDGLSDALLEELSQRGIILLEDVCESHGATHGGRRIGSFGWISNFSFYYAHHMSTIEGGMICTDDPAVHRAARMLRSHGMLREADDPAFRETVIAQEPDLNPDFVFMFAGYNVRNTEIGAILGRSQLKRLDANNRLRTRNFVRFLDRIDGIRFRTEFKVEGSSNYAFNLIQREPDRDYAERLMAGMRSAGIEFRRGSAGGGSQLRQPYLKGHVRDGAWLDYPETEHVHFFGYYIGNFPNLSLDEVDDIARLVNAI